MNILFYFISQINPRNGGTERVADNIAHGLQERGYNVYYMSRIAVPGEYDIPCFFLPDADGTTERNINFINSFCRENAIDIIINEAGNTDDVYLFSNEHIKGVKIVTELHFCPMQSLRYYYRSQNLPIKLHTPKECIINLLKWAKAPFNRKMHYRCFCANYQYMYEHSDKVVVLSPSYIQEFAKMARVENASKIISIYNPNTFTITNCSCQKEKIVLSIGRLQYAPKRIDYLLDIWRFIQPNHNDWMLQICGSGDYKQSLETYVKRHGIKGVSFEGNVDPQPFYEKASIMCMTSLNEGMPMVIVEAMQCGVVPLVYDTYSAAKDLISDGETGFVIPPFDKSKYAKKLSLLMDNEDLRIKMGVKAMQSTSRFDLDSIIDQWEKLIREI